MGTAACAILFASFHLVTTASASDDCFGTFPPPPDMFGFASHVFKTHDDVDLFFVRRDPLERPLPLRTSDDDLVTTHKSKPKSKSKEEEKKKHPFRTPTLVLLHGWLGDWRTWERVLPILPPDWRVVAVDLRGYGQSSKPHDSTYSQLQLASDVKQLVEHLHVGPVIVVGEGTSQTTS